MDTTFDFEKVRNRPQRYDRELYASTIKAIKKVEEIKSTRQRRFMEARMKAAEPQKQQQISVEVEKNIDLIRAPVSVAAKQKKLLPAEITQQKQKTTAVAEKLQNTQRKSSKRTSNADD